MAKDEEFEPEEMDEDDDADTEEVDEGAETEEEEEEEEEQSGAKPNPVEEKVKATGMDADTLIALARKGAYAERAAAAGAGGAGRGGSKKAAAPDPNEVITRGEAERIAVETAAKAARQTVSQSEALAQKRAIDSVIDTAARAASPDWYDEVPGSFHKAIREEVCDILKQNLRVPTMPESEFQELLAKTAKEVTVKAARDGGKKASPEEMDARLNARREAGDAGSGSSGRTAVTKGSKSGGATAVAEEPVFGLAEANKWPNAQQIEVDKERDLKRFHAKHGTGRKR